MLLEVFPVTVDLWKLNILLLSQTRDNRIDNDMQSVLKCFLYENVHDMMSVSYVWRSHTSKRLLSCLYARLNVNKYVYCKHVGYVEKLFYSNNNIIYVAFVNIQDDVKVDEHNDKHNQPLVALFL